MIDLPAIGSSEVLIEVSAAGLDRGVKHLMTGLPYVVRIAGYGLTRPKTKVPGLDVAGRVVAVGGEVTSLTGCRPQRNKASVAGSACTLQQPPLGQSIPRCWAWRPYSTRRLGAEVPYSVWVGNGYLARGQVWPLCLPLGQGDIQTGAAYVAN